MKMIPSIGTPVGFRDIIYGLSWNAKLDNFGDLLRERLGRRYIVFANSGTTAFFIILKALKRLTGRKEVILPAYTAPSLILPIRKAGLVPKLCDINLDTFNIDLSSLRAIVNKKTLAVTLVHMFGLPVWFTPSLEDRLTSQGIFLVEDFASALGSSINGRPAGSFGDISFVSFNRGKNLSTCTGGAVLTDREEIYRILVEETKECLKEPSLKIIIGIVLKTFALSFAVRPWFYTLLKGLISRYKYTELHHDFTSHAYTRFQAGIGLSLFNKKASSVFEQRYRNGLFLYRELSSIGFVTLPTLMGGSMPVFNQFPLLINDIRKRESVYKDLIREGIEATLLYPEPIHRVYRIDNGRGKDPFPNATCLSKRLLLIPTHPYVDEETLVRIVEIIKRHA